MKVNMVGKPVKNFNEKENRKWVYNYPEAAVYVTIPYWNAVSQTGLNY